MKTVRFTLYGKAYSNVSRYIIDTFSTLETAKEGVRAQAKKSDHFRAAGWEIEQVITYRDVVATNEQPEG